MTISNERIDQALQKIDVTIDYLNKEIDKNKAELSTLTLEREMLVKARELNVEDLIKKFVGGGVTKAKRIPSGYGKVCVAKAAELINQLNRPISTREVVNLVAKSFDFGGETIPDQRQYSTCYASLRESAEVESVGDGKGLWRLKTKKTLKNTKNEKTNLRNLQIVEFK